MLIFLSFMKIIFSTIFRYSFRDHSAIITENIALRHQIMVLKRTVKRPKLKKHDRIFWVLLLKLWNNWKSALFIVQPETVIK